jgi:anti-anti-sigma regulatory factor
MTTDTDIAALDPVLALAIEHDTASLRCAGRLDGRTGPHVQAAVEELLARGPSCLTIDVRALVVADADGADALAHVQRRARDVGVTVRWRGLDAARLHEAATTSERRAGRRHHSPGHAGAAAATGGGPR